MNKNVMNCMLVFYIAKKKSRVIKLGTFYTVSTID
jgi:hypothetical protein